MRSAARPISFLSSPLVVVRHSLVPLLKILLYFTLLYLRLALCNILAVSKHNNKLILLHTFLGLIGNKIKNQNRYSFVLLVGLEENFVQLEKKREREGGGGGKQVMRLPCPPLFSLPFAQNSHQTDDDAEEESLLIYGSIDCIALHTQTPR